MNKLEVPKMIQKVLEYVRGPQFAILEYIKTQTYYKLLLKSQEKTTKSWMWDQYLPENMKRKFGKSLKLWDQETKNRLQPCGGYGTTNVGYGTTNANAGVGIGMLKGGFKNSIKKAIN